MTISNQQNEVEELHEEMTDMRQIEVELKKILSKKMALEEENTDLKQKQYERFLDGQKDNIDTQAKDIENRGLLQKLKDQLDEERKRNKERTEKLQK